MNECEYVDVGMNMIVDIAMPVDMYVHMTVDMNGNTYKTNKKTADVVGVVVLVVDVRW